MFDDKKKQNDITSQEGKVIQFSEKERAMREVLDSFMDRINDFNEVHLVAFTKEDNQPIIFLNGHTDNIALASNILHREWLNQLQMSDGNAN